MTNKLKNKKQVLFSGLVLIALVIAYLKRNDIKRLFRKLKKSPPASNDNTTNFTPFNTTNDNKLSKGSTGEQVRKLQQLLNDKHRKNTPTFVPLLVEDGIFGSKTETMLKKYTGKTSISINQLIKDLQ